MEHPLIILYGIDAIAKATEEIEVLKANSNFRFTKQYMSLGIGFINIKAQAIVDKGEQPPTLTSLVSSSFGEAAIYDQCCPPELKAIHRREDEGK